MFIALDVAPVLKVQERPLQSPRDDDEDVYYPKGRRPREDEEGEESYEKQRQRRQWPLDWESPVLTAESEFAGQSEHAFEGDRLEQTD